MENDFPADSCRNQNNGLVEKGRNGMAIVKVGPISAWFSNEPLKGGLETFEIVHQALRQVISTPGDMAKLPGENLQRTSFPTLRASDVPWG